jgi:hypothetical protein
MSTMSRPLVESGRMEASRFGLEDGIAWAREAMKSPFTKFVNNMLCDVKASEPADRRAALHCF